MKRLRIAIIMAAGILLVMVVPAFPEATTEQGQGQAIVTVLPKKDTEALEGILKQNLQLKVNGKESKVSDWMPLRGLNSDLELVILIDGSARTSFGQQLADLGSFIRSIPSNVKVGVGYMDAGRAVMAGPLSTDHAQAALELHIPGGQVGSSGSPYFCLSDLARHWPSNDQSAQREAVLITDGVDNYYPHFDPEDPYVETAINDSVRSGMVVYSIFWPNRGRLGDSNYASYNGESLLSEVAHATGGVSYWVGPRMPVSISPYLDDIRLRLQNQYLIKFNSRIKGKPEVQNVELKVDNMAAKVYAPHRVFITH